MKPNEQTLIRITCEGAASVPLETLRNFQGNLKTLEEKQFLKLRRSIEEHGFSFPVSVWRDGGEHHIIDGHQRVFVLGKMLEDGREIESDIPVDWIEAAGVREAKKKVLLAASQYGRYDEDSVYEFIGANELEYPELKLEIDLPQINTGKLEAEWFKDINVDEKADEVPDVPKNAITKSGDLWLLGDHRLLCGDATKDAGVLMNLFKAQLVFTDPPYGVDYDGGTTVREKLAGDSNTELYGPACQTSFTYSDEKAALYLWHAGIKGIAAAAAAAAAAAGYEIRCEIVWNKDLAQFGSLSAQYKQKHEPAYYCYKKGKAPRWFGPTNEVTVWDIARATVNEFHPTQKPVELAIRAMKNSSEKGDCVGDWFLGSGSTMIAAEKLNRRCYGIEIEPHYVDVAVERWENYTGKKAKRKKA